MKRRKKEKEDDAGVIKLEKSSIGGGREFNLFTCCSAADEVPAIWEAF